jgi:hypothetical protein
VKRAQLAIVSAVIALGLGAPGRVRADAIFLANSESRLSLDAISGGAAGDLIGFANPTLLDSQDFTGTGAALGTASGVSTFPPPGGVALGQDIELLTQATGNASPPGGTAVASGTGFSVLSLFNSSSNTLVLSFSYDYRYLTQATTTGNLEVANASAIASYDATVNGVSVSSFSATPTATGSNGSDETDMSPDYPDFTTLDFTLTLAPFQLATITMQNQANGTAVVLVPEPSALALAGMGIAILLPITVRRRRSLA